MLKLTPEEVQERQMLRQELVMGNPDVMTSAVKVDVEKQGPGVYQVTYPDGVVTPYIRIQSVKVGGEPFTATLTSVSEKPAGIQSGAAIRESVRAEASRQDCLATEAIAASKAKMSKAAQALEERRRSTWYWDPEGGA
jgi:hypothetical protein